MRKLLFVKAVLYNAVLTGFDQVKIVKDVGTDPLAKLGGFIGLMLYIFLFGGVGLAGWGIFEFGVGVTKEGQADKKLQGLLFFAGGVILASAKFILGPKGFGLIS